ncbi:MAG: hypothetical protein U0Y82_13795 [Thermoleophilia bacterium]
MTGALVCGAALGAGGIASAVTSNSTAATSTTAATGTTTQAPTGTQQPRMDPSRMSHGPGETLANATVTAKITAAVNKALPGSTIIRVETDSGGHAWEAHVKKADGSYVTLYFDASFNAAGQDTGFGGPPPGAQSGSQGAQSGTTTTP